MPLVLTFGNRKRRTVCAKGHDQPMMEKTSLSPGYQEKSLPVFSTVTNLMLEKHI